MERGFNVRYFDDDFADTRATIFDIYRAAAQKLLDSGRLAQDDERFYVYLTSLKY